MCDIYQCGVCKCKEGFYGRKCECGKDTAWGSGNISDATCRETENSKICNGQGNCNCGECKCNTRKNPEEVSSYLKVYQNKIYILLSNNNSY